MVVAAAASLYGDVARGRISVGHVTLLYMLAVGAIPFEPRHAFGLGAVLTGLLHGMGTHLPPVLTGGSGLVRSGQLMQLGVATVLLTGISALLHVSRYHQHRARREAEAMREEVAELEAAKSRFFANLSHDLRTPLTLTIGPIEDALNGRYGTVPGGLRACADPEALRRIVSNLLSNALEHTPEESTVRIRARPAEERGGWVSLSVRDSGPGLPKGLKGRLVDRYVGTGSAGDAAPPTTAAPSMWSKREIVIL